MEYWDQWELQALEAGVDPVLAADGRSLMRDCAQHGFGEEALGHECDGPLMLDLAVTAPLHARLRFLGDLISHRDPDVDGDAEAFIMLSQLEGSDALEDLLEDEKPLEDAVWKRHKL